MVSQVDTQFTTGTKSVCSLLQNLFYKINKLGSVYEKIVFVYSF